MVKYFTDSRVVLGYIHNDKRRFFVYVMNRVERIRSFNQPNQWTFVPTYLNLADKGTRGVSPKDIADCARLKGTAYLFRKDEKQHSWGIASKGTQLRQRTQTCMFEDIMQTAARDS